MVPATPTDYADFAATTVDAVGGAENIKRVTHCATRLRFQLDDMSKVDKERIQALPDAVAVVEASGQLQVVIGMNVPDAYAAVAALPGVTSEGQRGAGGGGGVPSVAATAATGGPVEPDAAAAKPRRVGRIVDAVLGAISAIFTPYIPVLATVGILQGLLALTVNIGWLTAESNTYIILSAAPRALLYFFPILLAFSAAKQFGANQYVGAVIGAALLEPNLAAITTGGTDIDFAGIPFIAQSFANTVIPIVIGMWAFSFLEKGLKRVLPKVTRLLLVPFFSVLIMVPAILLVFGPIGFAVANAIAAGYEWLLDYPLLLSLVFGGFFIYVIMIGAHWVVIPIQLNLLATQGQEYSLAAGGMGNYALLGALLAVLVFNRDRSLKQVAGSAAFVNALSGITEPGLFGVIVKNKWYFVTLTLGGLAGGLVCGLFGTYITNFAFTGLLGAPAFASSPTAGSYFLAVGVTIVVAFVGTAILEKSRQGLRKRAAGRAATEAQAVAA